jgi:hypothetical protein
VQQEYIYSSDTTLILLKGFADHKKHICKNSRRMTTEDMNAKLFMNADRQKQNEVICRQGIGNSGVKAGIVKLG